MDQRTRCLAGSLLPNRLVDLGPLVRSRRSLSENRWTCGYGIARPHLGTFRRGSSPLVKGPWWRPRPTVELLGSIDPCHMDRCSVRFVYPFSNQLVRTSLRSGGWYSRQRRSPHPQTVWLGRLILQPLSLRFVAFALGHLHDTRSNKHQTSPLATEREVNGRTSTAFAAARLSPGRMAQLRLNPPLPNHPGQPRQSGQRGASLSENP